MTDHKRIANALADAFCTEDAIEPTAYAISSLETFFTPDFIVLESNRFYIDETYLEGVYRALARILPSESRPIPLHIANVEPNAAVSGCASLLRRQWFYDVTGLQAK